MAAKKKALIGERTKRNAALRLAIELGAAKAGSGSHGAERWVLEFHYFVAREVLPQGGFRTSGVRPTPRAFVPQNTVNTT